jgi:hypothetical protein
MCMHGRVTRGVPSLTALVGRSGGVRRSLKTSTAGVSVKLYAAVADSDGEQLPPTSPIFSPSTSTFGDLILTRNGRRIASADASDSARIDVTDRRGRFRRWTTVDKLFVPNRVHDHHRIVIRDILTEMNVNMPVPVSNPPEFPPRGISREQRSGTELH